MSPLTHVQCQSAVPEKVQLSGSDIDIQHAKKYPVQKTGYIFAEDIMALD